MLFPTLETEELVHILETATSLRDPAEVMRSVLALLDFIIRRETEDKPIQVNPAPYPIPFTDEEALVNLRAIADMERRFGRIPDTVNWPRLVTWCIGFQMRVVPYLFPRTNGE